MLVVDFLHPNKGTDNVHYDSRLMSDNILFFISIITIFVLQLPTIFFKFYSTEIIVPIFQLHYYNTCIIIAIFLNKQK